MIELFKRQKEILRKFFQPEVRELLVLGGYGSGKTSLGAFITLLILRLKNTVSLITRETEREIVNTIIPKIFELAEEDERKYMMDNWDKHLKRILHPSGSILYYLSTGEMFSQYSRLAGYEFNFALIDEASQISEEAYTEISQKRLRRPPFQKLLLLSNPTSQDHWLYQKFAGKEEKITSFDNPHLPEGFLKMLNELPEELKKIRALGEWGFDFVGKSYNLTQENIVNWTDDEMKDRILKWNIEETIYVSIDWGVSNMAVVLGGYDVDDDTLYFIDAWEYSYEVLEKIVDDIKEKLKNLKIPRAHFIGDIGGKRKDWNLKDAFEIFRKAGIYVRLLTPPLLQSYQLEDFLIRQKKIKIWHKASKIISSYFEAYKIEKDTIKKVSHLEHIKDATRYLVWAVFKPTRYSEYILPKYKF